MNIIKNLISSISIKEVIETQNQLYYKQNQIHFQKEIPNKSSLIPKHILLF